MSGRMTRCKDCQRYYNLTVNVRRIRKHGRTPRLLIEEDEFLAWARRDTPSCVYCGIDEESLARLAVRSSIGLSIEALGIDRLDNAGDYTPRTSRSAATPATR
jgi:hypothetical protein